jgi:hypothetical protein
MYASDFAAAAGLFIRVPCGIISNTSKVKIYFFCRLSFTALE